MANHKTDLLQGTLDLLVLKILALGPTHGWDISQRIQQISQDVLRVNQGSLYPALHRLEQQGWISSELGTSDNNRQAKFYRLTARGESSWPPRPGPGNASRGRSRSFSTQPKRRPRRCDGTL